MHARTVETDQPSFFPPVNAHACASLETNVRTPPPHTHPNKNKCKRGLPTVLNLLLPQIPFIAPAFSSASSQPLSTLPAKANDLWAIIQVHLFSRKILCSS